MASFVNNIFFGFGMSLILPLVVYVILSILLAMITGK
jgi:hypothetical protein